MDARLLLSPEDRERIDMLSAKIDELKVEIPSVLISNKEAARILGFSYAYVSVLSREGKLRRRTIGKSTGFLLKEVLEYKTRREPVEPQACQ